MQVNLFNILYEPYVIKKPIRLIELFAGVGSQAMALRNLNANFEHYKVIEYDKNAVASYNAIHGTNFKPTDITKISSTDLGITETDKHDYILTYSFPCQDLSVIGDKKGMEKESGTRSGLLWEVERLLHDSEELPQILLMENVTEVVSEQNVESFLEWCRFLENKGYTNYHGNLNAKDYGIPQNRNRCFMISILGEYCYDFPTPIKLEKKLKDFVDFDNKYLIPEKILNSFHKKTGDFSLRFKAQDGESCSVCVTTKPNWAVITNNFYAADLKTYTLDQVMEQNIKVYANSPSMCWRLMGFSLDDYEKASQVSTVFQLYKQAGNSIVVDVLEAIFKPFIMEDL